MSLDQELYQQVILEHNKKPRNFRKPDVTSHCAEGFNPLCGDHLWIYMNVVDNMVDDIAFQGDGCAISKASASMMTGFLKGKSVAETKQIFQDFHKLVIGELNPESEPHTLGRLTIFSGIWKYPSRVKCAALAWHTMNGALSSQETISTE
jgi:nitrogen fixation NifU-like protein